MMATKRKRAPDASDASEFLPIKKANATANQQGQSTASRKLQRKDKGSVAEPKSNKGKAKASAYHSAGAPCAEVIKVQPISQFASEEPSPYNAETYLKDCMLQNVFMRLDATEKAALRAWFLRHPNFEYGTLCSGTDGPRLVFDAFADAAHEALHISLTMTHKFSCVHPEVLQPTLHTRRLLLVGRAGCFSLRLQDRRGGIFAIRAQCDIWVSMSGWQLPEPKPPTK